VDGDLWVEGLLTALPGGELGFLIVVNLLVFLLAFFLDFFEIAFIIVPLLAPVAQKLGIDLVWFGVLLGINMQTSFMHPPFGFACSTCAAWRRKRCAPAISTGARFPSWLIQIIMVVMVLSFPGLVGVRTNPSVPGNDPGRGIGKPCQ
jgi:TRAP-type mannitol/chloroaromatic compound transport system permease large subunit